MSRAEWTVMVYLGGVNNLAESERTRVNEMTAAASGKDVNVVYEIGTPQGTERGIGRGQAGRDVVAAWPVINSAAPSSLTSFIDWAEEHFPARFMALVLVDHGGGFKNPYDPKFGKPSLPPPPPDSGGRGGASPLLILSDDLSNSYLTDEGLRYAIASSKRGRVDLLGFDACEMGAVETAYEMSGVASFMVATEDQEPSDGWPYGAIVRDLCANPARGPRAIAAMFVARHDQAATKKGRPSTFAAFELAWMKALKVAMDAVGSGLQEVVAADPAAATRGVKDALTKITHLTTFDTVDLRQALHALQHEDFTAPVGVPIDAALAALRRAAVSPAGSAEHTTAVGRLSVFFPPAAGSPYLPNYGATAFARHGGWAAFLGELFWQAASVERKSVRDALAHARLRIPPHAAAPSADSSPAATTAE